MLLDEIELPNHLFLKDVLDLLQSRNTTFYTTDFGFHGMLHLKTSLKLTDCKWVREWPTCSAS